MLKVFTSTYRFNGASRFDVTVKGKENKAFAPTWDMVMKYKNGVMNKEQYTEAYTKLMDRSYKKHKKEWDKLLSKGEVTLVCFCKAGDFCHRLLLAEMLVALGGEYCGEV